MRVPATSVDFSNLSVGDYVNAGETVTNVTIDHASPLINAVATTGSSSLTQYRGYGLRNNNSTAGYIGFSAEL